MAKRISIIVLLPVVFLISACAATLPEPEPLQQRLAYTPEIQARYTLDKEWWRSYGDPQLNRLVATAIERNTDLAKAAVTVNKALYTARRIGADLLPEFSASGEGHLRRELDAGGTTSRSFSTSGGVSYEADLWLKLADTASAKEWELRASVEDKEAARLILVTSTADFYFELMYLHSATITSQAIIDSYKQIHHIVSNRHQYGKVSALEPEQAAQAVLTEEKRLHSLEIRRKEVENSLRLLLGYEPGIPIGLAFTKEIGHVAEAVNLNVPMAVLANRPDLKAAEYRLQGAFKDVSAAQKAMYPTITLSAALGVSSDSLGSLLEVPFTSGTVLINLPFLQWNKIKWNVKISEAEYSLLKLELEKKLNTALNEVAMAYAYYANATDNLRNAEGRYMHSRSISGIYQEQYEHGKRELSDWLDAMNTMWAAWMEVLENRYYTLRRTNEVYKTMAGRYQE